MVVSADLGLLTESQRLLIVKLIRFMEEDMDLSKRATKAELMAMSQKDFDAYYAKATLVHENWSTAEHRSAHVLKNDLAAFQARTNGLGLNGMG
jgi:hypothetical protein